MPEEIGRKISETRSHVPFSLRYPARCSPEVHTNRQPARISSLLLLVSLATGCTTLHPSLGVASFGVMDPALDKRTALAAAEMEVAPDDVLVIAGTIPEGLDLADGGSKLVVLDGYRERYRIIGTVESDYTSLMNKVLKNNMYGAWKYDQPWRRTYCYPQVPLKIVTAGLWSFLPMNYPCLAMAPRQEEDRQIAMIDQMKRGAKAMGGNLLFVTQGGSLRTTTVNAYGQTLSSSVTPYMSLTGFVLEVREIAPPPANPPAPSPAPPGTRPSRTRPRLPRSRRRARRDSSSVRDRV